MIKTGFNVRNDKHIKWWLRWRLGNTIFNYQHVLREFWGFVFVWLTLRGWARKRELEREGEEGRRAGGGTPTISATRALIHSWSQGPRDPFTLPVSHLLALSHQTQYLHTNIRGHPQIIAQGELCLRKMNWIALQKNEVNCACRWGEPCLWRMSLSSITHNSWNELHTQNMRSWHIPKIRGPLEQ